MNICTVVCRLVKLRLGGIERGPPPARLVCRHFVLNGEGLRGSVNFSAAITVLGC